VDSSASVTSSKRALRSVFFGAHLRAPAHGEAHPHARGRAYCSAWRTCQRLTMQLVHGNGFVNRHSYGRTARVLELATVAALFAAFLFVFGAVLSQVL